MSTAHTGRYDAKQFATSDQQYLYTPEYLAATANPPPQQPTLPSLISQYPDLSARSRPTPLYAGLTKTKTQTERSRRTRSRTPLPPPASVSARTKAREAYSKSASFPYDAPPTFSSSANNRSATSQRPQPRYNSSNNSYRSGNYYHNSFASGPVPVFDPVLPSPIVVVHGTGRLSGMNKSIQDRKHRGTSRNVLGGFYTS